MMSILITAAVLLLLQTTEIAALVAAPVQTLAMTNLGSNITILSTDNTAQSGCNYPHLPPFCPVSLQICGPAFAMLLNSQGAALPRHFEQFNHAPIRVSNFRGCAISLLATPKEADIDLSVTKIVGYATHVLLVCERSGQGGWTRVNEDGNWWVTVNGFVGA